MNSHPDPETLAAYVDRELNQGQRHAVEAHLADCDSCREVMFEAYTIKHSNDNDDVARRRKSLIFCLIVGVISAVLLFLLLAWDIWHRLAPKL